MHLPSKVGNGCIKIIDEGKDVIVMNIGLIILALYTLTLLGIAWYASRKSEKILRILQLPVVHWEYSS